MPSRPPPSPGDRGTADDYLVVRRVPIALSVALEVVAELRARERETRARGADDALRWAAEALKRDR